MAVLMAGMLLFNAATATEDDFAHWAEVASVDEQDLRGASYTTGLDPYSYLVVSGHLPFIPPPPPKEPAYGVWDRLAQCESGGNWHINAYHDGGLQFLPSTWNAHGGQRYARFAYQATRAQQIEIAQRVLATQGWRAWPVCSRRIGMR